MRRHVAVLTLLVTAAVIPPTKGEGPPAQAKETVRLETRRVERDNRPEFDASPGWEWLMSPQPLRLGESFEQISQEGILTGYIHVTRGGGLRIFLVHAGLPKPPEVYLNHRLVIFDAAGNRHLPSHPGNVMTKGSANRKTEVETSIFSLGPEILAPEKAAYIAIERKTPKGD